MDSKEINVVGVPLGKPLEEEAVQEFAAGFRGELIRPEDDGYDGARAVFNAMIERRPALIARCTGVADVRAAVNFARENDLVVAVRGGGLIALLIPLFLVLASLGGINANNTALALAPHPGAAGSASALLGTSTFGIGAVIPSLASLLGTHGWVMGATMVTTSLTSLCLLVLVVRPWRRAEAVLSPGTA